MLKKSIILCCLFISLIGLDSYGQADGGNPIEKRAFYRSHNVYGGYLHTAGLGAYYRRGWRQTAFSNKILNIEILNIRHPKEFKRNSIGSQNVRSYYFGKINSVAFIRTSFGWEKTLFDKEVEKGVRVSYHFLFGGTLGLVKPVYVIIDPRDSSGERIERYDFAKHENALIKGRAPFMQGVTEISPRLGIHIKYGLTFEFSKDDERIKALETGVTFDGFIREIPIMAETYNNRFFLTFYLSYHFGKRSA
ncbi:MAG: hypothetical protein NWQ55_08400 [Salibacteraceae bacterium]|nr:hypothetical protein [Salibacteraceae bacterium]MDP4686652.1 hypothetical protein [Salibacteraceae bacterium]MDP4763600.1 hypothetical protein [Salibacteraceae bacterium]MDP4844977.1 hypothetical protein [Salibacteraceae bacterium]MDP4934682.1 hypothetical protein [Salibacteraceae bacterium]